METRATRIETVLRQRFAPDLLVVQDDSHLHAGHAGAAPSGETHYSVLMTASTFHGQTRVARARLVHEALDGEFASGLHALALTLRTPVEQADAAARA